MGRPINKRNFSDGTDPSKPSLILTAKVAGYPAQDVPVLSQSGTRSYRVEVGGNQYTVRLVEKTDSSLLLDGEALILAGNDEVGYFSVNKITQHMVSVKGSQGKSVRATWDATPASEGSGLLVDEVVVRGNEPVVLPTPVQPPITESSPVVTYNDGINIAFQNGSGYLNVGTGIDATSGYTVAKTNYIELALTSHIRGTYDRRTINDNLYTLTMGSDTQWNVTWSIGVTHPEITNITELYDVKFYTYLNNDGSKTDSIVSTLVFEGGIYKLRNEYGDVIDSGFDVEMRSAQNSTSLTWISTLLVPPVDAGLVILGNYVTEIVATNLSSGQETRCEIVTEAIA